MDPLAQDERISAYLDGELPDAERAKFEEELTASGDLRQLVEELRTVRESMQALPHHRLEHDFAERVLRRAERLILTGQPTGAASDRAASDRAVAAAQPASAGQVTPAAKRELVASRATGRHWQSRRPWAWSAVALSVAAVIAGYERWQAKDKPLAVADRSEREQVAKGQPSLPTGNLFAEDESGRRMPANKDVEALRRTAGDNKGVGKQVNELANAPQSGSALRKSAQTQVPATVPSTAAPVGPALAKKPGAESSDAPVAGSPAAAPPSGPTDKAPFARSKDNAAGAPASSLAGGPEQIGASELPRVQQPPTAPADRPSAAPQAGDGRANSVAGGLGDAVESRAELQRRAVKTAAVDARVLDHGLLVVECAAAPEVPRQAFHRLLAEHGIALYEAAPASTTFAAPADDSQVEGLEPRAPQAAPDAAAPATALAAPAPTEKATAREAPPLQAKLPAHVAGPPAVKPKIAVPSGGAITAADAEEQKKLESVDQLQIATPAANNVVMYFVEGTPEQVLGLVSDLRSQPVVYRSVAVGGAATSPPQEEAAKATEKRADRAWSDGAANDNAELASRARTLAQFGRGRRAAGSEGAWAVQLVELPRVVTEQLKQAQAAQQDKSAKSDEPAVQLSIEHLAARDGSSSGKPSQAPNRDGAADKAELESDTAATNGARSAADFAGGRKGGAVAGSAAPGAADQGTFGQGTSAKPRESFRFIPPGADPGAGAGGALRDFDEAKESGTSAKPAPQPLPITENRRDQRAATADQPAAPPAAGKSAGEPAGAPKLAESQPADDTRPSAKDVKAAGQQPPATSLQLGSAAKEAGGSLEGATPISPPARGEAAKAAPARMQAVIMFRLTPASGK